MADDQLDLLDYYTLLQVDDAASTDDIRTAFHNFALRYHPDRHADTGEFNILRAAQIYRRGTEAYRVLCDPKLRREYDEGLREGKLRLV